MNRSVLLACLAALLSCSEQDSISPLPDAGPCGPGRNPRAETCNGLDDDCNGIVDDIDPVCRSACGPGQQRCHWTGLSGFAVCDAPLPRSETCNGIDDDCDGQTDEPPDGPAQFCYQADPTTAGVGPCHPGVLRCPAISRPTQLSAPLICSGAVTPAPEVCGNGIDDDCNGRVDDVTEPDGEPIPVDLALLVDRSCSMSGYLPIVANTLVTYLASAAPATRIWVFDTPGVQIGAPASPLKGCPDQVPFEPCPAGQMLYSLPLIGPDQGGDEPTFAALSYLAENLAWDARPVMRIIVLFGDEEGQPPGWQWRAASIIQQYGIRVFVWTDPAFYGDYANIVDLSGGLSDLSTLNVDLLLEQLRQLTPTCE